jgi:hypothetical protein
LPNKPIEASKGVNKLLCVSLQVLLLLKINNGSKLRQQIHGEGHELTRRPDRDVMKMKQHAELRKKSPENDSRKRMKRQEPTSILRTRLDHTETTPKIMQNARIRTAQVKLRDQQRRPQTQEPQHQSLTSVPKSKKRPLDTSNEYSEFCERAPKVPKVSTKDRGLRLHMARVHAREKHEDRLKALGGPGHEQELMGAYIELGWVKTAADGKCHFCRKNIQIEMFVCPEGGARACTPCKMRFSYYTSC